MDKDAYNYPVHGWHWFDNEQNARTFFGLPGTLDADASIL
jgi:hypothetical protein